ncbi:MAG: ribonuclease P protein component [Turicibacter sp.]|nr:ribonuclease P protein component [Turicibacter sp.]
MKKDYRIKKSQEIEKVMKKGFSKANRYFIVYKYVNSEHPNFRLAISVGKKLGNAVTRNTIKRRIRAVCTEHKDKIDPGYDYFIIGRKGISDLDFLAFKENLEQLFTKMKIIPKE